MLPTLSWLEQQYIKGGLPEQKYALVSVFGRAAEVHSRHSVKTKPSHSSPFAKQQQQQRRRGSSRAAIARPAVGTPKLLVVANVHLDAAGDNTHRTNQLAAVGAAVASELSHTHIRSTSSGSDIGSYNGSSNRKNNTYSSSSSISYQYSTKNSRWPDPSADVWPSAVAVVCGDFNCFRLQRSDADNDLANMVAALAPLSAAPAAAADTAEGSHSSTSSSSPSAVVEATLAFSPQQKASSPLRVGQFVDAHFRGAGSSGVGPESPSVPEDTHWFARSNEDGLGHRIAAALGKKKVGCLLDENSSRTLNDASLRTFCSAAVAIKLVS